MPFVTNPNAPQYNGVFQIQNLIFDNQSVYSSYSTDINPSIFGFDPSLAFVSGNLAETTVSLAWSVINPINNSLSTQSTVNDYAFSGFSANIYDLNRNLIYSYPSNFRNTQFSIAVSNLQDIFSAYTGSSGIASLNQFYIDVVATDYYSGTSTGTAYVNFVNPDVANVNIQGIYNPNLSVSYANYNLIRSVDAYLTTGYVFDPNNDIYLKKISTIA